MNPRKKQPMQNSIKRPVRQSNAIGGSNSDSFMNHSTHDNNNRNSNEYQDDNVLTMQATGNEKGIHKKFGSTVVDDSGSKKVRGSIKISQQKGEACCSNGGCLLF
jgi:hypothetical protein